MSTKQSLFKIGGIEATILRKNVKNLHLNVLPPVGKVRVSVPSGMGDDAIQTFLATHISWIKKQQDKFKGQERQAPREYVSGESHYFLGKRYRLEVQYLERKSNVVIKGKNKMILTVRPKSTPTAAPFEARFSLWPCNPPYLRCRPTCRPFEGRRAR